MKPTQLWLISTSILFKLLPVNDWNHKAQGERVSGWIVGSSMSQQKEKLISNLN